MWPGGPPLTQAGSLSCEAGVRLPPRLIRKARDTVQETGIKTILKRKKCKKAKWLSVEALQIAMKRGEKQRRKGKIVPSECRVPKNNKER